MPDKRPLSLEEYFALITRSSGGPAKTISTLQAGATAEAGALERAPVGGGRLASVSAAAESIELGRALSVPEQAATEAIINEELRPAIDIVDGRFTATHPLWAKLSTNAVLRQRIEAVLPSVGRVELPGSKRLPYGGTGFIVGDGIIMTNRHVAEIFAAGLGDRSLTFQPNARAGIDFLREYERPTGPTLTVDKVLMIHPYWDMALLRVTGLPAGRQPLKLSGKDARELTGREIFIVGYPAFDGRNPTGVQNNLFNSRFGIKRLQPGQLQGAVETASFAKLVTAAGHDCSTLGGNSGSAVFDLDTGEVLGLHFGGAYHQINYAVPAFALAQDSRVVQVGVRFAETPRGDPNTWGGWWKRADAGEGVTLSANDNSDKTGNGNAAGDGSASGASPPPPTVLVAPAVRSSASSGEVSFEIPLRIAISLGQGRTAASVQVQGVERASEQTEAMREPAHDTDYDARTGYNPAFLGADATFSVPLPKPLKLALIAPTLDKKRILHYENFSVVMHAVRRLALFTASNVTKEVRLRKPEPGADYSRRGLSGLGPNDMERWFLDPRMDAKYQIPNVFYDKDRQAFDKGHIVRRDDVAWGKSYEALKRANGDTYHVTNCSPQVAGYNRSALGKENWGDLENLVLTSAASERLCVFAGPVLTDDDEFFSGVSDGGVKLEVGVPRAFWKVVIACVEDGIAAFGFILEQDLSDVQWEFVVPDEFVASMYPLAEIQQKAGLTFPKTVLDADQFDTERGAETVLRGVARRAPPGQT